MIYSAIDLWSSSYLDHYGVKGMKWGVRKDRYSDSINTVKRKAAKTINSYEKKEAAAKKRRLAKSTYAEAKSLSDRELIERTQRINLEQNYINAMKRDREAYRDATDSILMKYGRSVISLFDPNDGAFVSAGKKAVKKVATTYFARNLNAKVNPQPQSKKKK